MAMVYNPTDPNSILDYAKKMIGKTFYDILEEYEQRKESTTVAEDDKGSIYYAKSHARKNYKGGMGNLVEERYFEYKANSDENPDFPKAGVELKVTPYKTVGKNNELRAKERLILTMIDYFKLVQEKSFEESHLWHKCHLMLLVWYLYIKGMDKLNYRIDYVDFFIPSDEDLAIIKNDYYKIVAKVKAGKAHELSEADTLYLGAATKAADSTKRRKQPFSDIEAKPRAFSLKNSYMTYVLNHYYINKDFFIHEKSDKQSCTPNQKNHGTTLRKDNIFPSGFNGDFESNVIAKINKYRNYTTEQLCRIFGLEYRNGKRPKNLESILAFRMLGIKGNHAEEFTKANVVVKAIRIEANGKIKQSMSFPTFKFTDIVAQTWEESTLANYLKETRFFFVVYRYKTDGKLYLKGAQFWNIPYKDLEIEVRSVWERTKAIIQNGLEFYVDEKGKRHNNLPKSTDNYVCHVRPHGRDAKDTYPLPDGREYTKQCFWLNKNYILSQISNDLKED